MNRIFAILLILITACAVYGQGLGSSISKFKSAFKKDKYEKARELIPSVLSQSGKKFQNDPEKYSDLMNMVGLVLCEFDEYTEAATYFELAIKKTKEQFGDTTFYYALYSFNLASTYDNLGRYLEAEPLYLLSLPVLSEAYGQSSLDYTKFFYKLALMYTEMGRYAEAEQMNLAVIYFFKVILGKNNDDYQGAQNNLARIYEGMGKYKKAEDIFISCLDYYRKQSPFKDDVLSTMLNNIGELYWKTGNYKQAEDYFFEAIEIAGGLKGHDPLDSATICNNLALLYKAIGNYSKAEYYYMKSISIYEIHGIINHPDYTNPLNNLGELYRSMGRYNDAVEILIKVINLREKLYGTRHHNYANAVNNLALVYFDGGNFKEAEEMYLICKDIYYSVLGENHDLYANCLNNLAVLYRVSGRPMEAENYYMECLRITENVLGKNHKKYALYLNGAGVLYSELGDSRKAIEMITQAMEIVKSQLGEHNYDYIDMAYNLAEIYRAAGEFDRAMQWYFKSMNGYISLINFYFPALSEKEKTEFYYTVSFRFETFNSFAIQLIQNDPGEHNNELIGAMYDYQLAIKSLLLNEITNIREKVTVSSDSALIDLYYQWEDKRKHLALQYRLSADELALNEIDIDLLEKEVNTLDKELSAKINAFKQTHSQQNVKWKDVQVKLGDGEAAVEIIRVEYYHKHWTDTVYYIALAVDNQSKTPKVALMQNGVQMESEFIEYYRNAIWYGKEDDLSYKRFWLPVQTIVKDAKKIYFSPDGVYHKINPYTLKNEKTGKYVLYEVEIQFQTNTKDLLRETSSGNGLTKSAEIFGYPDYEFSNEPSSVSFADQDSDGLIRFGYQSLAELPGTKDEANSIKQIMSVNNFNVNIHLGADASEKALKAIQSPDILHIATHGYFLTNQVNFADMVFGVNAAKSIENPLLRSGLMLAGAAANARRKAPNLYEEDGIFSAYEAMLLDLENTELVVLSACETGLGEVRNGQGVYGLQRAFIVAGADAIMMSLWQVEDVATQELMKEFYELWLKNPEISKQEAFRKAQLKLKERFPRPIYWGAFVMTGN